jgi:hypothetical protein
LKRTERRQCQGLNELAVVVVKSRVREELASGLEEVGEADKACRPVQREPKEDLIDEFVW